MKFSKYILWAFVVTLTICVSTQIAIDTEGNNVNENDQEKQSRDLSYGEYYQNSPYTAETKREEDYYDMASNTGKKFGINSLV